MYAAYTVQGKDFELILTLKWKLYIRSEDRLTLIFSSFVIIVSYDGLESQDLEFFLAIFAFFEKTTLYGKIFTASPIDVVVWKFRKIFPTKNRRNRASFT